MNQFLYFIEILETYGSSIQVLLNCALVLIAWRGLFIWKKTQKHTTLAELYSTTHVALYDCIYALISTRYQMYLAREFLESDHYNKFNECIEEHGESFSNLKKCELLLALHKEVKATDITKHVLNIKAKMAIVCHKLDSHNRHSKDPDLREDLLPNDFELEMLFASESSLGNDSFAIELKIKGNDFVSIAEEALQ
jgi:hypothetical protein